MTQIVAPLLGATGPLGIVIGIFASFGLSFLAAKLAPKPKAPNFAPVSQLSRVTMRKEPVVAHQRVYGEARVGTYLSYMTSTSNNQTLWMVAVICGHEVDAITTVYLNDEPIYDDDIAANGDVTVGRFANRVRIFKRTGTATQTAVSALVSDVEELDSNFRGQGIAYVVVRVVRDADGQPFPNGVPNISCRVRAAKVFDPRDGGTRWHPSAALCIRDYLRDSLHGLNILEANLDQAFLAESARRADEIVETQPVTHQSISVNLANNDMSLDGDVLKFQTGDRIMVTEGGNSTAPAPLAVSTNYYAIVTREKKSSARPCGIKFATTYENAVRNIHIPLTMAGAGSVTVTKDGEPRYTCNGVVDTSRNHRDILIDLAGATAGRILNAGGKWRIIGGFFVPAGPDAQIGTTDMRNRPTVVTRHSRRERFNAVKGVYFNPLNFDQPSDYPPVTNATFEAADLGERRFRELDLPFTSRSQQAQRIARIGLRQHRQEIVVKLQCNLGPLTVQAGDTIQVTDPDVGWTDKEFEVLRWQLSQEQTDDGPLFVIDIDAQETAAESYDFPLNEEQTVDPAPNTNLPAFDVLSPVENLRVDSGDAFLFIHGDGTVHSGMQVSWDPPDDGFLGSYNVEWRLSEETVFAGTTIRSSSGSSHIVRPVIDKKTYIVQVRAVNSLGVPSEVRSTSHVVQGKSALPSAVDVFLVQLLSDGTRKFDIVHDNVPIDVSNGGGYRIRYAAGTSFVWETATPLHSGLISVFPYENNLLDAGVFTFGIKAVDSSGNESANAVTTSLLLGGVGLGGAALYSPEGERGWPGTKTDSFVFTPDGSLMASGGVWSSMPSTWAGATGSWDAAVGLGNNPITYETEVFDLTADTAIIYDNVLANGDGTITVEARDNTAAQGSDLSAVSYAALPSGSQTIRYVQFRVTVDGTGPDPDVRARLANFIIILSNP